MPGTGWRSASVPCIPRRRHRPPDVIEVKVMDGSVWPSFRGSGTQFAGRFRDETFSFDRQKIREVVEWLTGDESHDLADADFVAWTGRRLRKAGLPVDRLTLHLRTLHPEFLGRTVAWSPGAPARVA